MHSSMYCYPAVPCIPVKRLPLVVLSCFRCLSYVRRLSVFQHNCKWQLSAGSSRRILTLFFQMSVMRKIGRNWTSWELTLKMRVWNFAFLLLTQSAASQLVVNVKNLGGDILKETIDSNTTADTIVLDFQQADGTLITQFIDFKNVIFTFIK